MKNKGAEVTGQEIRDAEQNNFQGEKGESIFKNLYSLGNYQPGKPYAITLTAAKRR